MHLSNSDIKYLRSLKQKKYRDSEKKFILEGWRPLLDALNSDFKIEFIAILPDIAKISEIEEVLSLAKSKKIPIMGLKENQLSQVSDTVNSQGIISLLHQKQETLELNKIKNAKLILACDRINDPGNLGTILRTCDWFGVGVVLLNSDCVSLYNEKVIRATAGSIFHLNIYENINYETVIPKLKSLGFKFIATALEGKPLFSFTAEDKYVIILGNEAQGVDKKLIQQADELLSIPRFGKAESLNVGIACGVILAHYRNQ